MAFNIEQIRADFPALKQTVYGKPLVYMDNAATTLKPSPVIEELKRFYEHENSNIHRGTHYLSQIATEAFEQARQFIADYINAGSPQEIIFVRGATEGINLVARSFSQKFFTPGDEVIISGLEHHSNIVPWQMACNETGAKLKVIPVLDNGSLDLSKLNDLITSRTKIIAVTHISNALGIINPVREIIELAHSRNVPVLIDGAQGIVHTRVDVQHLDCDFYCFSGHKLYGPMGIGVLYGKSEYLAQMPPYQGGGEMISDVSFEKTTYNELPFKFEAGTPNVSAVLGLRKAIEYIDAIGIDRIRQHEDHLLDYLTDKVKQIPGMQIYGTHPKKAGVLSFLVNEIHPYDIGVLLDKMGIAVRTGHHCAQPLMDRFGIPGTVRLSLAMYNTKSEIDQFCEALEKTIEMLQ
jgi:cysteine desulfurase / selenocysteine lyase